MAKKYRNKQGGAAKEKKKTFDQLLLKFPKLSKGFQKSRYVYKNCVLQLETPLLGDGDRGALQLWSCLSLQPCHLHWAACSGAYLA